MAERQRFRPWSRYIIHCISSGHRWQLYLLLSRHMGGLPAFGRRASRSILWSWVTRFPVTSLRAPRSSQRQRTPHDWTAILFRNLARVKPDKEKSNLGGSRRGEKTKTPTGTYWWRLMHGLFYYRYWAGKLADTPVCTSLRTCTMALSHPLTSRPGEQDHW